MEENEQYEEDKPSLIKKILLIFIGIFLIVLLVSYLLPGDYLVRVLQGQIVSSTLGSDYTLTLKNGDLVVFDPAVYTQLKEFYFEHQKDEFKVCLLGRKNNNHYLISGMAIPKVFSQSFAHVSAEQCSKETIIPLHKHPYKSCLFSQQDIRSYEAFHRINKDALIGLMCEIDRFTFYGG